MPSQEALSVETKFSKLAAKAEEWRTQVSLEQKLAYLEQLKQRLNDSHAVMHKACEAYADELKQVTGDEREYFVAEDMIFHIVTAQGSFSSFIQSYKAKLGHKDSYAKQFEGMPMRKVASGHVVASVFPILFEEKTGPVKDGRGEVWFQRDKIKEPSDVKLWDFDRMMDTKPGVSVVLGAGNYPTLTVVDVVYQLFQKGNVVFLKHHHIRPQMEEVTRFIFQPLFEAGFMDSETHHSHERSSAIVYNPHVTTVHMTGGKHAHDIIVWGSTPEEQAKNKKSKTPKLKATMSSELGAATPHIITPVTYTNKELDHQAQVLVSAKWVNGGASCNAPQCVIMSDQWPQKKAFLALVEKYWKSMECPVAYYPGTQDRVDAFQYRYKDRSTLWMGKMPSGAKSNHHMPLLVVNVDADVSTEKGLQAAKQEYALRNEAFGPILVLCTLKTGSSAPKDFMAQAVTLCNECLFGTLACSIVAPDKVQDEEYIDQALADLKYGSIVFNSWAATGYPLFFGQWGGHPSERVDNVESGVGHVHNALSIVGIEKTTLKKPILEFFNPLIVTSVPRKKNTKILKAVAHFVTKKNLPNFLALLESIIGPALYIVPAFLVILAVAAAFVYKQV